MLSTPHLTGHSLAAVGVAAAGGVALHTQALVAAMGVDAELAAGEGGAALVHIRTRAAIILQPEAGVAAALRAQGALAGDWAGVSASPDLTASRPRGPGVGSPRRTLVPTTRKAQTCQGRQVAHRCGVDSASQLAITPLTLE